MTQVPKGVLDQIKMGRWRQALASFLYLLDPFDAVPDRYGVLGYRDDIAVLHKTHAAILRKLSSILTSRLIILRH